MQSCSHTKGEAEGEKDARVQQEQEGEVGWDGG